MKHYQPISSLQKKWAENIKSYLLTTAVLFAAFMRVGHIGGTKLVYGKCHCVEDSAGIVLVGSDTFLIGNAILGSIDKVLTGTNYAYNRENTYAHKKISVAVLIAKASAKTYCYALGYISTATAGATRGTYRLLVNARRQNDGIYNLDHRFGKILDSARGLGGIAEAVGAAGASEYAYVAFAAVKNDLLLYHANTLKFLRSSRSHASLKQKLDEKSYGYGVKSAIKANGVDVDIGPGDGRLLCAHVARSLDDVVSDVGEVYPNILKAVAVTAGIEYSVGFYADGLLTACSAA